MSSTALQAQGFAANITASDLPRSIKFYTEGLGFEIVQRYEAEGVLRYVAMKAGSAEVGLGTDDFAKGRDRVKGTGLRISITTGQDIHALAERAKNAGITLDDGPAPLAWGPLGFSLTDPDGFKLTIANPMPK
jgi:catechol 2,3-dioxygenase-like lactoylglutathione lyase family enzyme